MRLSGGVEIRTAVAEDAPGLATVHVRSWQLAYRGLMADEFLDGLSVEERERWHSSRLSRLGRGEAVLVAVAEAKVVGFAATGACRDPDHLEGGELYSIYVDPPLIGTGVGSALLAAAERMLAGYRSGSCLWVAKENHRAIRFYERWGWVADGTEKSEPIGGGLLMEVRYRKDASNLATSVKSSE